MRVRHGKVAQAVHHAAELRQKVSQRIDSLFFIKSGELIMMARIADKQLITSEEYKKLDLAKAQRALIGLRLAQKKGLRMRSSTFDNFLQITGDCLAYRTELVQDITASILEVRSQAERDVAATAALPPEKFAAYWLFDQDRREEIDLTDILRSLDGLGRLPLRRLIADSIALLEQHLGEPAIRNRSFPSLRHFADLLELTEQEQAAILLGLLRAESHEFCDFLQSQDVKGRKDAVALLGCVTGYDGAVLGKAIPPSSRLYEYGIFEQERESRITDLMDIFKLSDGFTQLLMASHPSLEAMVRSFLKPADAAALTAADYPHMQREAEEVVRLLRGALESRACGIHVMLYGDPGTGKTEFARMLAGCLGASLYEIDYRDEDGDSLAPTKRYGFLRIAQQFLARGQGNLLLFDEAEDVFPADAGLSFFGLHISRHGSRSEVSKAWLNRFLESSPVPVVWISNQIAQIDTANLRRFAYHLEFQVPPAPVRQKVARRYLTGLPVSAGFEETLAELEKMVPARLESASRFARLAAPCDAADAESLILSQLQKSGRAMGMPLVRRRPQGTTRFDLRCLNIRAEHSPSEIIKALRDVPAASFCFYGMPGTGKTELAAHIASALGRELMARSGSDLLSKWVGGTEKNIAAMFHDAEAASQPVLLLDEADALLAARSSAQHRWEASQVNEFLFRMEGFNGIFICTTNRLDELDQALLRRFTFKVEFLPLKPEQRVAMFKNEFPGLARHPQWNMLEERLHALEGLTPGDFSTVKRQITLLRHRYPAPKVVAMLEQEVRIRTRDYHRGIGFVTKLN